MQNIALETLAEIAELSVASQSSEAYEAAALELLGDPVLARRALDWLPEAFGLVLATHIEPSIQPPETFMAQCGTGEWIEFPVSAEPIFAQCVQLASVVYHHGPREVFEHLALSSAIHAAVNGALNQGVSLKGGKLQPLRVLGVPAEAYGEA